MNYFTLYLILLLWLISDQDSIIIGICDFLYGGMNNEVLSRFKLGIGKVLVSNLMYGYIIMLLRFIYGLHTEIIKAEVNKLKMKVLYILVFNQCNLYPVCCTGSII